MAAFPDKYNYDKVSNSIVKKNLSSNKYNNILCVCMFLQARLPGPLTEELQEELKERKKAKQKRAKEKKVFEELKKEEEIEKQKFLQLSDREKVIIMSYITYINRLVVKFQYHYSVL